MDSDIIVSDSIKGNEIPHSYSSVINIEVLSTEAMVDELTISLRDTKISFCLINKSDVNIGNLSRSLGEVVEAMKFFVFPQR